MTLEARDLDQSVIMTAFMDGLQKNDLKRSLIKSFSQDYAGMLERTRKYTNIEEVFVEDTPTNATPTKSNKECLPSKKEAYRQHSRSPPKK